jgi:hypothetical protein
MQLILRSTLAVPVLILAVAAGMGASSARAQAVVGGPYRGGYPGYYYSPGGYNGGYYFSPGYYPIPGSSAGPGPVGRVSSGTGAVVRSPGYAPDYYDQSTGRTNLAIPLAKPWLRPLR